MYTVKYYTRQKKLMLVINIRYPFKFNKELIPDTTWLDEWGTFKKRLLISPIFLFLYFRLILALFEEARADVTLYD